MFVSVKDRVHPRLRGANNDRKGAKSEERRGDIRELFMLLFSTVRCSLEKMTDYLLCFERERRKKSYLPISLPFLQRTRSKTRVFSS